MNITPLRSATARCSMAETISENNAFSMFGTTTAIMSVWLLLRLAALELRWYPSLAAVSLTRLLSSSFTVGLAFRTFETVPIETRASRAMSWIVGSLGIHGSDETFHGC